MASVRTAPPLGGAALEAVAAAKLHTASASIVAQPTPIGEDVAAQLHRRRVASDRLAPLAHGFRDPWCGDARTADDDLIAWRAAAEHLRNVGLHPLLPSQVRRALEVAS